MSRIWSSIGTVALFLPAVSGCNGGFRFFSYQAEEERNLSTPHVAGSGIEISTRMGSVEIHSDPSIKEVKVVAKVTVTGSSQEKADSLLPDVKVVMERRADKVLEIKTEISDLPLGYGAGCAFKITVPDATGCKVKTGLGSVKLDGLGGAAETESSLGSIAVNGQKGTVVATTGNGSIHVSQAQGEVKAKTAIGAIHIKETKSGVIANSGNGSIEIEQSGGSVEAGTHIGAVKIRDSKGEVTAKSGNGSVTVVDAHGPVKAKSSIGQIKIEKATGTVDAETGNGSIQVSLTSENHEPFHLRTHIGSIKAHIPSGMGGSIEGKSSIGSIQIQGDRKPLTVKEERHAKTVKLSENGTVSTATTGNGSITLILE